MVNMTVQTLQDELAHTQAELAHTQAETKKYRGMFEESLDIIKNQDEKMLHLVGNNEWLQNELKTRDARLKYYENSSSPPSQNSIPTRTRKQAARKPPLRT